MILDDVKDEQKKKDDNIDKEKKCVERKRVMVMEEGKRGRKIGM